MSSREQMRSREPCAGSRCAAKSLARQGADEQQGALPPREQMRSREPCSPGSRCAAGSHVLQGADAQQGAVSREQMSSREPFPRSVGNKQISVNMR